MARVSDSLLKRHFGDWEHPYRTFEREVDALIHPASTLVDVGCGRSAPVLQKYRGRGLHLIGLDCVEFDRPIEGLELVNREIGDTGLASASVDVVMARSVMEHIADPESAYREVFRILRPGGHFTFITANFWDYGSLVAWMVPNAWHPFIVRKTEGRAEEDTFPIQYKTNTKAAVYDLALATGFRVQRFEYLGQYPNYLLFSRTMFLVGTAYEKFIARFRPLNFLRGWLFVTLQKP